jgi:antitoxin (DNA-binding transcriptional repressor) of toxin-antitoxin stability system
MLKITVKQASSDLKVILKQVAKGEEVLLTEHNQFVWLYCFLLKTKKTA